MLSLLTKKTNLPVYLRPVKAVDGGRGIYYAPSRYYKQEERIEIAEFANHRRGNVDYVMLHEIIHAFTYETIQDSSKISEDFYKLFSYAQSVVKEDHYGLRNADEFAAELFANPQFIETLKKYPSSNQFKGYKNLWEEILDFIKNLLGFKNYSLYDESVTLLSNLIQYGADFNMYKESEISFEEYLKEQYIPEQNGSEDFEFNCIIK